MPDFFLYQGRIRLIQVDALREFAVFKCEATANSVTGHMRVNSNEKSSKNNRNVFF